MKPLLLFMAVLVLPCTIFAQPDKNFNALLQKGIKQVHDERKHDAAIQTFNEAVKLKPLNAEVYGYRGYTYLEKAELEEYNSDEDYINYRKNASWLSALIDFNKCIGLDPTIASAYYHRGMAYAMNREIKSALSDFNKALQLDPTDKKINEAIKDCKENFVQYSIDMAREAIDRGLDIRQKNKQDTSFKRYMRRALQYCTNALEYDAAEHMIFFRSANALYWLNEYNQAETAIKNSLALKPGDKEALDLQKNIKTMIDYVKQLDKGEFTEKKIIENNSSEIPLPVIRKKNAADEPDEVIRNLGNVLQQVVASAADPRKHFKEFMGGKMKSRYYRGDAYRSSLELPGALETFLDEFLNYKTHSYHYWYSLIDEEAPAKLKGRIKYRYKAVCNEIKLLYPGITPSFRFNDENNFEMQMNKNVTIKVTYFYSEGYKDVVTLAVVAQYEK